MKHILVVEKMQLEVTGKGSYDLTDLGAWNFVTLGGSRNEITADDRASVLNAVFMCEEQAVYDFLVGNHVPPSDVKAMAPPFSVDADPPWPDKTSPVPHLMVQRRVELRKKDGSNITIERKNVSVHVKFAGVRILS